MLLCASWKNPPQALTNLLCAVFCAAMHNSRSSRTVRTNCDRSACVGERKFASVHGTVCFTCLPAPVPMLFDHVFTMAFLACRFFREYNVVPLPPTARLNRCHGKVPFVYLHGRLFDCTRSSSIAPNVNSTCRLHCRCCSRREIFPSIYIPTRE